jgi:transcriptional regulator with XRE-family HTH domain
MQSTITETAAKELGRSLRFIRQARSLTLRDMAKGAQLSPQYIAQVELAQRLGVSEEALRRLAKPLGIPETVIADLLLRARIQSALEVRGLNPTDVTFVWRGVEQRLSEVGVDMKTDISKVVVDILG